MEREREREREGMKKSGRRILSLLCVHVRYFSRSPVRSSLSREKEREREREGSDGTVRRRERRERGPVAFCPLLHVQPITQRRRRN